MDLEHDRSSETPLFRSEGMDFDVQDSLRKLIDVSFCDPKRSTKDYYDSDDEETDTAVSTLFQATPTPRGRQIAIEVYDTPRSLQDDGDGNKVATSPLTMPKGLGTRSFPRNGSASTTPLRPTKLSFQTPTKPKDYSSKDQEAAQASSSTWTRNVATLLMLFLAGGFFVLALYMYRGGKGTSEETRIPQDVPQEWVSARLLVEAEHQRTIPTMDMHDDDSVGKPTTTQTKRANDDSDTTKAHPKAHGDDSIRAKTRAFVTRLAERTNPKKEMHDSAVTPNTAQTRRANDSETTKDTTKAKTRLLDITKPPTSQHKGSSPKESSPLMVPKQKETSVRTLMQRGLAKRMHWVIPIAAGGLLPGMRWVLVLAIVARVLSIGLLVE
jgi:hypothetical protein